MFVLDTDTLSLLLRAHPRVTERVAFAKAEVTITLITRIEIL
jgi:predicted nucleic acid-binding protein